MTLHLERRGAGAPFVLLHGWGFHSAVWEGFADELARDRAVHLVDLPGHGLSRATPLRSLDDAADEVAAVIPERSVVCGWSLGGLVAQRLAQRHPGKAKALVLLASTPCFVQRENWPHGMDTDTLERFGQDLRDDPEGTLRRFVRLNTLDAPGARPAIRKINARLHERPFAAGEALDAGLEILRDADIRAETPALGVATLVIHGTRDRIVPPGAGRWLAQSLPRGTLVELPASAHLPFVTDRTAVLGAIGTFHG
jgi:pimeloyl-[acyl-carrier protein] methyl ester esterase